MVKVVFVILSSIGAGTIIWIRNGHRKRFKERAWALLLLLAGTFLIISQIVRIPLPNPIDVISAVYAPIYKPIVAWLEKGGST